MKLLLSDEEIDETLEWLDKFEIFQLNKRLNKINRDFSDAVLLAAILKQLYPKLVEMHNYPHRSSTLLKFDNWQTLNRKVLKKLNLSQNYETLNQLSNGISGTIEILLNKIMLKVKLEEEQNLADKNTAALNEVNLNTDIMTVNVMKTSGDGCNVIPISQKMILYSLYESAQKAISDKNKEISMLDQKVTHLENMLKLKSERIYELNIQLARKPSRFIIDPKGLMCAMDSTTIISSPPSSFRSPSRSSSSSTERKEKD